MHFYESLLPSIGMDVAIRIMNIQEYGVEVALLEYGNAPNGIIYNKELSHKRIRSIKNIVRVGQETMASVIDVSPDSIGLSIKHRNQADIDATINEYNKHRVVHNILKSIAFIHATEDNLLDKLYESVVWPIARQGVDVYDTFLELHGESDVWYVDTPYLEEIRALVKQRIPPPNIIKYRDIRIQLSTEFFNAPTIITDTLNSVMKQYGCDVFVIAPPLYRIQVVAGSDEAAEAKLVAIESYISNFHSEKVVTDISFVDSTDIVLDLADIANRQALMNIGTLGNVSEGKSTLVCALSKVATQRHKKEKVFNITINLGYAGFKIWRDITTGDLSSTSSAMKALENKELLGHYSFVDCPGHEAYMATMLSGTTVMDAAALIIASNSERIPQVQTQEHLIAAEIMGLSNIFVIQNKLDLVDSAGITESLSKIRAFVKDTSAEQGPIIPISAQREWGIDNVMHHIAYNMPVPARTFDGPVRMQIVRSFDINRPSKWGPESKLHGGVIGGTINRGVLHPGDLLEIRPGLFINGEAVPIITRVSSMNCDSESLPFAVVGGLIGVGTALDSSLTSANALVGHVAGTPGSLPEITMKLKGKFKSFDRSQTESDGDLTYKFKKHKEGEAIKFCVGSMTVTGRISKVGDKGKRTIKVDRPICVEVGQVCSIMRLNGSRYLLDGVLIVEAVSPFKSVRTWDTTVEAVAAKCYDVVTSRKYNVIQNERIQDPVPLPSYECMLDSIELRNDMSSNIETIKLPLPVIQRLPKKTAWLNIGDIIAALQQNKLEHDGAIPLAQHFQEYLMNEFSTTLTVKKDGQYVITGRFTDRNFHVILKKYVMKYHKCKQCGSYKTCLFRSERVTMFQCGGCTSVYSISE